MTPTPSSITKSDKIALSIIGSSFALCALTGSLFEMLPILFVLSAPWVVWRLNKLGISPWLTGFGLAFIMIGGLAVRPNSNHSQNVAKAAQTKPLIAAAEARPFTAEDFIFDEKNLPTKYKDVVIAGVNKIRNEDTRCQSHISPASTSLAASKSKPNKPVFYVTCGSGGANLVNVYFTPEDVKSAKTFTAPKHFADAEGVGRTICDTYIKTAANFPETVDLKWGATIKRLADGRTIISREFTSKNAYGVPRRYRANCTFGETEMTQGEISEVIR